MAKKIKRKGTINMNGKSHTFDLSFQMNTSHTDYSGYGYHEDKQRKAKRRDRKMEERRARRGEWE